MSSNRPARVLDPVCGMSVDVAEAEADGRTHLHEGRTYAFCRAGCLKAFLEEPAAYVRATDSHAEAETHPHLEIAEPRPMLVIDEGLRRWYESCSCCLSDAYPEVKAALDAERAAAAQALAAPGICEVAEAGSHAGVTGSPAAAPVG